MSAILFLGTKNALSKTEYSAHEVYRDIKYPDSLFFRDGIAFDDASQNRQIGHLQSKYYWYEVKTSVMLFDYESKKQEVCPDLYEASLMLSEWFILFLSFQIRNGNELCLLRRWVGNSPKKVSCKTFKISGLKPTDQKLPYDTLLKLN